MARVASPNSDTIRHIASAAELVNDVGVEIVGVTFFKYAAAIVEGFSGPRPEDLDARPEYELLVHHENRAISTRLRTVLRTTLGDAECDAAIDYVSSEPVSLEPSALEQFANDVALMALLPYVREALASLTGRVFGETLVMPVMKRGQLAFKIFPEDEVDSDRTEATPAVDDQE